MVVNVQIRPCQILDFNVLLLAVSLTACSGSVSPVDLPGIVGTVDNPAGQQGAVAAAVPGQVTPGQPAQVVGDVQIGAAAVPGLPSVVAPADPGGSGPGGPDLPSLSRNTACDINALHPTTVRRLSNVEYHNTIEQLLGVNVEALALPATVKERGFENFSVHLNPSALLVERYQEHAQDLARRAVAESRSLFSCEPSAACGEQWVQAFGLKAFRRPLTVDEFERYHSFFESSRQQISFNGALELTIAAFLQSPNFIYRMELVPEGAETGRQVALAPYEMASRLSYLVLQSMPDDELFAAAANGHLSTDAEIRAQVERLMTSPAAAEAYIDFHRQWLQLDKIDEEPKSAELYPEWGSRTAASVKEEASRFVGYLWDNKLNSTKELLTNRTAVVDDALAGIYGVPRTGDWQGVQLRADERAGILTRAAFVAGHSHNTPSPPLRGNAVLDQLLCTTLPSPPPSVDTSAPANTDDTLKTNRQLFVEKLEVSATCQGCHIPIDGVGYLFENYDAIGRFQTQEVNGLAIDSSGALIGTDSDQAVRDAVHLSEVLGESEQVSYCAVSNMYRFAFGRDTQSEDWCKTDLIYEQVQRSGGDLRQALVAIATSHEFKFKSTGAE